MRPRKIKTGTLTGLLLGGLLILAGLLTASPGQAASESPEGGLSLEQILTGVENRHAGAGFSARFEQRSVIKAMNLADTATGTILVKRPGKMRWAYETPETQLIITNGTDLWIYKPEDNQVALGRAPTFFADGKGASFLSDMKLVREKFNIRLEDRRESGLYVLNLTPRETNIDISAIYLSVSPDRFEIQRVVTFNAYGDENRIDLKDIEYKETIDDALFIFKVPKGVDVLRLDENY